MSVLTAPAPADVVIDITPEHSFTTIRGLDIRDQMEILIPGKGVVTVAHVLTLGTQVFVTNNKFDEDVDVPIHLFETIDEVQKLETNV